jgi:hypothetical protein
MTIEELAAWLDQPIAETLQISRLSTFQGEGSGQRERRGKVRVGLEPAQQVAQADGLPFGSSKLVCQRWFWLAEHAVLARPQLSSSVRVRHEVVQVAVVTAISLGLTAI